MTSGASEFAVFGEHQSSGVDVSEFASELSTKGVRVHNSDTNSKGSSPSVRVRPSGKWTRTTAWAPVVHGARTPIVVCVWCHARILNETNGMRRAGWQQVRWGRSWVFACHRCSAPAGRGSDRPALMPLTLLQRHTHL
jgi:hypothetical protein